MKRTILVTGGAGYIGSHTVAELDAAGFSPVIIDDFSTADERALNGLEQLLGHRVPVYCFDCSDRSRLRSLIRDLSPTGVIHFAAFKAVEESVREPLKYYRNNIGSLLSMLEVMQEEGVRDIVFSSSCTVYGQPGVNPVDESTPLRPASSPYGYTKQVGEQLIRDAAAAAPDLRAVMLRYFNPIGAHPSGMIGEQPRGIPNNLVPYLTQAASGLVPKLVVHGTDYATPDGSCIRDFIHIVDLAKAHVRALTWLADRGPTCEVFNIGQGRGDSVLSVIETFERTTGVKVPLEIGPRRPGDVEQIWANVDKAWKEMGWRTEFTIVDAMRDAWRWQLRQQQDAATPSVHN